jgi:iron-sulfur cluster assembly accessory protein
MSTDVASAPIVQLTPAAAEEIRELLRKPENAGKAFRLYVDQGGCSGMQYAMTFDEPREGDVVATCFDVSVLVDSFSAQYLKGVVVNFSQELSGGGFKISNPNARESCGCGKSFAA